jgi:hypothetical protein
MFVNINDESERVVMEEGEELESQRQRGTNYQLAAHSDCSATFPDI